MLQYSEYKDVMEILKKSDHEKTYQDLMKKETKVLDTVNAVVKNYKDRTIRNDEFVERALTENISRFWMDMNLMTKELFDITDLKEIPKILSKGERIIYLGLCLVMLAVILFFVEISK
jgi:hypothetical protein